MSFNMFRLVTVCERSLSELPAGGDVTPLSDSSTHITGAVALLSPAPNVWAGLG